MNALLPCLLHFSPAVFVTTTPTDTYKTGQADRYKLARGLRATLEARQVSSSAGQICYGVQWIGSEIFIYAMSRLYAEFFNFTELFRGNLKSERVQVFRATLALRSLIQDQANLEFPSRPGREPARVPLHSLPPTPSKVGLLEQH